MSAALDVAIGVAFLYLSLSLVVTTLQELIASAWRLRAGHLYKVVASMLDDGQAEKLFNHPLLKNLSNQELSVSGQKLSPRKVGVPSYIPSKTFALALLDVLRREKSATQAVGASDVLADAAAIVATLPEGSKLKESLTLLVADSQRLGATVDERAKLVSERIEGWFNDRMARASGWYKQRAQLWSLGIAAFVTLVANADSIYVVNRLWGDATLRAVVVAGAQTIVASHPPPPPASPPASPPPPDDPAKDIGAAARDAAKQLQQLATSGLPVGWHWTNSNVPCPRLSASSKEACWNASAGDYGVLLLGWLLTTMALSLGANFWFDLLSRALQLRGSGPRVSEASGRVEK